ncbi:MAG: hypothetical protein ACOCX1_00990 [Fimbriimonadaceae bacterium]
MQPALRSLLQYSLDWRPDAVSADTLARWTDHDAATGAGVLAGRLVLTVEEAIHLAPRFAEQDFGYTLGVSAEGPELATAAMEEALGFAEQAKLKPELIELDLANVSDTDAMEALTRFGTTLTKQEIGFAVGLRASQLPREALREAVDLVGEGVLKLIVGERTPDQEAETVSFGITEAVDLGAGFRVGGQVAALTNGEALGLVNLAAAVALRLSADLSHAELQEVLQVEDAGEFHLADDLQVRGYHCPQEALQAFRDYWEGAVAPNAPELGRDIAAAFG